MSLKIPSPVGHRLRHRPIDERTLAPICSPQPGLESVPSLTTGCETILSGRYWVDWANVHARNSQELDDLAEPFRKNVRDFIDALESAGAKMVIEATRRDAKRAYLFHWSWLIALGKSKPSVASKMAGLNIQWDHGSASESKAAAMEMVQGFDLVVPPKSKVAPALKSHHIAGKAIDIRILWAGSLQARKKNGSKIAIPYLADPNANKKLHELGASYGVIKHISDAPHWSVNGR